MLASLSTFMSTKRQGNACVMASICEVELGLMKGVLLS